MVVEREPLSSLGIRVPRWRDVLLAIGLAVLGIVVGGGLYLLAYGPGFTPGTQHAQEVCTLGLAERIHVDINAAVVEELFFRGLLIECLMRLFQATVAGWKRLVAALRR